MSELSEEKFTIRSGTEIRSLPNCEVFSNYPLIGLNSWNVGGCCKKLALPKNTEEAVSAVKLLSEQGDIFVLGGGTNVLVADGNIELSVISACAMSELKILSESADTLKVGVGAGFKTKDLLAFSIENELTGAEFLAGIPGTVGGAVWGNAGAAGEGFCGVAESFEIIGAGGDLSFLPSDQLTWRYRECPLPEGTVMITGAVLSFKKSNITAVRKKIRRFADLKRNQPLGRKTAGCVFKNPENDTAGRLIDAAGCKGLKLGDAIVSTAHANFIENCGAATASEIFALAEKCREIVFEQSGIRLDYEIHFLGDFPQD